MRKQRNKERRHPGQTCQPAEKKRKLEGSTQDIRRAWGRPIGGGSVGKRYPTELNHQPLRKKVKREVEEVTDRYAEFGESNSPEFYDWEGKMAEYRREIEREEMDKNQRKEKAQKLEKSWELLRMCRLCERKCK